MIKRLNISFLLFLLLVACGPESEPIAVTQIVAATAVPATTPPTPIPSPTSLSVEVAREELLPQPSATPAACTPLRAAMSLEIVPKSETAFILSLAGLQPGDSLIFQITGTAPTETVQMEFMPVATVSPSGEFFSESFDLRDYDTISAWQGKVIHSLGVACFDITLPIPSEPIRYVATGTPSPTPVSLQTAAPAITHPLRTDQVILFGRDHELWRSDVHGILIEQLTTGNFLGEELDEPDYQDTRPHLSPNGRYAAQFTSPDTTRLIDLGTGSEITLPSAWEMAWSPDSRTLAYASHGIKIIDVVTGTQQDLVTLSGEGRVHNLAWSGDGTRLAYDCCFVERKPYDGYSDGDIRVIDLATGTNEVMQKTSLGVATTPPDFCWTEGGDITIEIEFWMGPCSLNFPFDDLRILSIDNVEIQWEANMGEDGSWLNTRLFATNRATDKLVWERTFDLQSMPVMAWSPDGRYLFFDDQASDSPIWRLTADGQNLVEIIPSGHLFGVVGWWEAFIPPLTVSPNGQWLITKQTGEQIPPEANETQQFPDGKYHVTMQVSRTDGSVVWTAVNEWRPAGQAAPDPQPLRWSADGRTLFFTNVPLADGCGGYVNGSDLWRLDLSSGQLTQMTSFIGLSMDVSPDGTKLAVHAANGRGFLIRDLLTEEEKSVALPDLGGNWALGKVLWSPDGQRLLLTWVLDPCSPEQTTAVIRVDADALTATVVVPATTRNFTLLKWMLNDEVRLLDDEGRTWYLEVFSGELAGGFFGF